MRLQQIRLLLLSFSLVTPLLAAPWTVTSSDTSPQPVVIAENSPKKVAELATTLADYLQTITGRKFLVRQTKGSFPSRGLFLSVGGNDLSLPFAAHFAT